MCYIHVVLQLAIYSCTSLTCESTTNNWLIEDMVLMKYNEITCKTNCYSICRFSFINMLKTTMHDPVLMLCIIQEVEKNATCYHISKFCFIINEK